MTQSEFFELARIGSPVLAALLAGGVAWRFGSIQAATARKKLKLDLFEHRWTVYSAAKESINVGAVSRDFPQDMDRKYQEGIAGARWVFDKEIEELLQNRVWMLLMEVSKQAQDLRLNLSSQELIEVRAKRDAAAKQLAAAGEELERLVAPYLQLES